mmetsp:Transcript_37509/g.111993  ORF Transcript_37509/g.111993 Transcript_37509/m.111993 type:complete len:318 (+) Transcript_37509:665-1618(+)
MIRCAASSCPCNNELPSASSLPASSSASSSSSDPQQIEKTDGSLLSSSSSLSGASREPRAGLELGSGRGGSSVPTKRRLLTAMFSRAREGEPRGGVATSFSLMALLRLMWPWRSVELPSTRELPPAVEAEAPSPPAVEASPSAGVGGGSSLSAQSEDVLVQRKELDLAALCAASQARRSSTHWPAMSSFPLVGGREAARAFSGHFSSVSSAPGPGTASPAELCRGVAGSEEGAADDFDKHLSSGSSAPGQDPGSPQELSWGVTDSGNGASSGSAASGLDTGSAGAPGWGVPGSGDASSVGPAWATATSASTSAPAWH